MKTYKVLSLLFLLLITLSCNVVKMLKQDDGKIPDDFFKGKGPIVDDTMTFFTCNLYYTCYFDTKTEQVVDFYSSAGGNFYPYNGNIYFSDGGKTYKYDFNNVTEITVGGTSIVATNFTEFQGFVYFLDGTNLYYINNQDQSISLGTLNSNWLTAVHSDQGSSKFYSCTQGYLKELTISYTNGEPSDLAETQVTSFLNGDPTDVLCDVNGDNFQVHGNFIYINGSTIEHYASDINQLFSETNPISPFAINMTDQGGFFYVDSSSELKRYNFLQVGTQQTISTSNFVSLPVIESSDEYFYVGYDDADLYTDQLYRIKKTDPEDSGVALTNLPASTYIYHFEVGSRGFYFFTDSGIYKFEFSSGETYQVHSLSFDGSENFSTFSHSHIYQN
jgi:hypothetical protein